MKRPDMMVAFGPVASDPGTVTDRWLSFGLDELKGSLGSYFARLEFDPEEGEYDFTDERLDLQDEGELRRRMADERNGLWKFRLPMGFANADVYTAVFSDPGRPNELPKETGTLLRIEPSVTRFFEEQEETRAPFSAFLIRAANAVKAPWFLAGLHLPWKSLTRERVIRQEDPRIYPYIVGWHRQELDPRQVAATWRLPPQNARQSVLGYDVVGRFANP